MSPLQDECAARALSQLRKASNTNNGLVSQMTCTNTGVFVNYGYDVMDRVTNIAWKTASSNVLKSFAYQFNAASMVSNIALEDGSRLSYAYDDLDRLTGETSVQSVTSVVSYAYDEVGNRTQKTRGGTTVNYSYSNGCNRLTGWTATSTNGFADTLSSAVYGLSSELIGTNPTLGRLYVSNTVSGAWSVPSVAGTNGPADYGLGGTTTRTDGAPDVGRVDMGYHYAAGVLTAGYYTDLYVSAPSGNDANGGTNWTEALQTIGKALALAQDGTRVHIAAGRYTNGLESFPLRLAGRNGVQLLGTNRDTTIIVSATNDVNALELIGLTGRTRVEGVTITGVRRAVERDGMRTCGGVYSLNCADLTLASCTIADNWLQQLDSGQSYNTRNFGGGIYAENTVLTLTRCVIVNNRNRQPGGYATTCGAGVYGKGSGGRIAFYGCELATNWLTAATWGAGAAVYASCPVQMRNCLVRGNIHDDSLQSAFYLSGGGTLENCTVADNITTCGVNSVGAMVGITNTILWNNGDDVAGAVNVAYSDIQTGDSFWTNGINGCISVDPQFLSTNDYRLKPISPCVDQGLILPWIPGARDLGGRPRIAQSRVDMGAYERPAGGTIFVVR